MSIRNFVSGSSVALAGWLGITFLNDVPSQRYPRLDKMSSRTTQVVSKDKTLVSMDAKNGVRETPVAH